MAQREFPELGTLHRRHFGLTRDLCRALGQAAAVGLARHHEPPTKLAIRKGKASKEYRVGWKRPTKRVLAAWANRDDATRDGAYAVCIGAIEAEEGLFAIRRAETRTGADYYLSRAEDVDNLEDAYRLEVSGVDHGNEATVLTRLKEKVEQARKGDSDKPAIASVVGFKERIVIYAPVESDGK